MHMLPKSHKSGFYKHESGTEFHIGYGMVDRPKPEEVRMYIIIMWYDIVHVTCMHHTVT